jgi:hypothetical protein
MATKKAPTPKWLQVFGYIFFGGLLLYINIMAMYNYSNPYVLLDQNLAVIDITLREPPKYLKPAKGSASMLIYPSEYPELQFSVSHPRWVADLERDVTTGDTLTLTLLQHDLDAINDPDREVSGFDDAMGANSILCAGVESRSYVYLTPQEANDMYLKDDEIGIWVAMGMDVIFLIIILFRYVKKQNT